MSIISGFDGEPVVEVPSRSRRDKVAPLPSVLAGSSGLPNPSDLQPRNGRDWTPITMNSFGVGGLGERSRLLAALDAYEPKLAELWQAHTANVEALREVLVQLEQLDGSQRAELLEYEQQVSKALREGKPAPRMKATSWDARRTELDAQRRALHVRAIESAKEYGAAAERVMPAVRERLAGDLERLRAEAARAWAAAERPIRAWRGAVSMLDLLASRLDPERDQIARRTSAEGYDLLAAGRQALGTIPAWIASQDPVVSGLRHTEPATDEIPQHVRRAWFHSDSQRELDQLSQLEASENYRVSSWTRPPGGIPHSAV